RGLLAEAPLFHAASSAEFISALQTRCATPYFDPEFWRPGWISIGEKSLALDPLSSTGVEKSMRLALQAVIAANTVLSDQSSAALARDYYEARLLEAATMHTNWTRGYYAEAWPGSACPFWRDRSSAPRYPRTEHTDILDRYPQISDALNAQTENRARIATR